MHCACRRCTKTIAWTTTTLTRTYAAVCLSSTVTRSIRKRRRCSICIKRAAGTRFAGCEGPAASSCIVLPWPNTHNRSDATCALMPDLRAVSERWAILITARCCDSQFEWAAHEQEAIRQGVPLVDRSDPARKRSMPRFRARAGLSPWRERSSYASVIETIGALELPRRPPPPCPPCLLMACARPSVTLMCSQHLIKRSLRFRSWRVASVHGPQVAASIGAACRSRISSVRSRRPSPPPPLAEPPCGRTRRPRRHHAVRHVAIALHDVRHGL